MRTGSRDGRGRGPGQRRRQIDAAAYAQFALGLVAIGFGVTPAEIMSPSRRAPVAFARQTAMYLLHVELGLNLSQAGRAFGRDRTTASHACHVIEDARESRGIDKLIEVCAQSLRGMPQLEPVPPPPAGDSDRHS